jgi:hypothetical protein
MQYSIEVRSDDGQFIEMLQGEDINSLLNRAIDLKTRGFLGYYYEKKKLKNNAGKGLADYVTRDIKKQQERETSLFELTINSKLNVSWNLLLKEYDEANPQPVGEDSLAEPVFEKYPPEPKIDDSYYQYKFNVKDEFIPFRKQKSIDALKQEFEKDYRKWAKQKERVEARNRVRYEEFMELRKKQDSTNNKKFQEWEKIRNKIADDVKKYSNGYSKLNSESVEKFCELILNRSDFKGLKVDRKPALKYVPDKKFLFLEFSLPRKEDLLEIKEITYDADGEQFLEVEFTDSELEARYVKVLENVAFKVIYEILSLDSAEAIEEINFRGVVKMVDRITGRNVNIPVLSLSVDKEEFLSLNYTTDTLQDCFDLLEGVYTDHHLKEVPVRAKVAASYQTGVAVGT